ncbi:MAG: hypothetical protein K1X67_16750 [Fimbriimonadaceae bacterium]|nr:hypothetical protein [Fimbriimonadaceae bacterium]
MNPSVAIAILGLLAPANLTQSVSHDTQPKPSGTLVLRDCMLVEPRDMSLTVLDAKSKAQLMSCGTTVDFDGTF